MGKNRKLNRLPTRDYSRNGTYHVTIYTKKRIPWFGHVKGGRMELSRHGEVIERAWLELPNRYPFIKLHEHVVMPEHFHGLIEIDSNLSTNYIAPPKVKSLSVVIGAFKMRSSKQIRQSGGSTFRWQRSFHDRIVRSIEHRDRIANYIQLNPQRWKGHPWGA